MGEIWRSEEMQLVQLFVQIEAAHDTVDELGKVGLVQFRDLNPNVNAFQRNFVNEVKRADEMMRRLRTFEKQIEQFNKEAKQGRQPTIRVPDELDGDLSKVPLMDELESKFETLEKQIQEMTNHQDNLNRTFKQLIEVQQVLLFAEVVRNRQSLVLDDDEESVFLSEENRFIKFGSLSGVIARSRFPSFEKILFRATRGNLFMKHEEIKVPVKDPQTGQLTEKNVFVIFFQGERLEAKIRKICDSFSANLYPCPETPQERTSLMDQVNNKLQEIKMVVDRGWDQRYSLLSEVAMQLPYWTEKVNREKSIYHTMNLFNYDLGRRCLIAEGWCPIKFIEKIQLALREGRERSGALIPSVLNIVPTQETPPTWFQTDNLTRGFQNIVNSYGTARYREVNPAVFTVVTFPFEFGVMFGDVGHGMMLLLAASFMIYMERYWEGKKINEMIEMVYNGRYTILLMAMFSVYIGALYNELFALPMNFGSNWEFVNLPPYNTFKPISDWTYPFGVDPVWKGATNELTFYNSLKMKTSVIIGVCQMSLGLLLHLFNGIYFRQPYDIFFEFIPRFLFLMSTFGYLVAMIFIKWNTDYTKDIYLSHNAPILLNEMIYMFLPGNPNTNYPLYPLQSSVQPFLVIIALVSIPMMMLPKPILLLLDNKAQKKGYSSVWGMMFKGTPHSYKVEAHTDGSDDLSLLDDDDEAFPGDIQGGHNPQGHGEHGGHGDEFEFSEVMVHQGLETIEFVLGCVSHTASYLRLWALSLAHSELATVFWEKIMGTLWGFGTGNWALSGFMSFIAFSAWFAATVLVLLGMESLSAFLHALRLHWVEFQSKFYRGDGCPFIPFSYVKNDDE